MTVEIGDNVALYLGVEGVEELAYSDQELQGQIRKSAQVHFYRHQV